MYFATWATRLSIWRCFFLMFKDLKGPSFSARNEKSKVINFFMYTMYLEHIYSLLPIQLPWHPPSHWPSNSMLSIYNYLFVYSNPLSSVNVAYMHNCAWSSTWAWGTYKCLKMTLCQPPSIASNSLAGVGALGASSHYRLHFFSFY